MWGAIVGDVAGSAWEFRKNKNFDVPLFNGYSQFTDDSVCSAAIAQWLTHPDTTTAQDQLLFYGRLHMARGFGGHFLGWLRSDNPKPYGSWGNGSAMRVSPCALMARDEQDLLELVFESCAPTHGHVDAIHGAQCLAVCIRAALEGAGSSDLLDLTTQRFGYNMDFTIDGLRPTHTFDVSCSGTVPIAIACVLESSDFETVIRKAISLGGDADTIAACAGPIAEALFGIPQWMLDETRAVIHPDDCISDPIQTAYALNPLGLSGPKTTAQGPIGLPGHVSPIRSERIPLKS